MAHKQYNSNSSSTANLVSDEILPLWFGDIYSEFDTVSDVVTIGEPAITIERQAFLETTLEDYSYLRLSCDGFFVRHPPHELNHDSTHYVSSQHQHQANQLQA